jgi:hypothetical protein
MSLGIQHRKTWGHRAADTLPGLDAHASIQNQGVVWVSGISKPEQIFPLSLFKQPQDAQTLVG